MADNFNLGAIEDRIKDPAIIQAARNAAIQYEHDRRDKTKDKHHYIYGKDNSVLLTDVKFSSNEPSAYTNLLIAICNYAIKKGSDGYSPKDKNISNEKAHIFKENKVPFDQYSVIIYDSKQGGCTNWKYVPYGLVYPEKGSVPENLPKDISTVAKGTAGSRDMLNSTNYERETENYVNTAHKHLVQKNMVSGGTAAESINETLIARKKITDDFARDIRGDNILNDFCNILMNKIQQDSNFREDFFATAQGSPNSELYRWLLAVGYNKDLIYELSGYQN